MTTDKHWLFRWPRTERECFWQLAAIAPVVAVLEWNWPNQMRRSISLVIVAVMVANIFGAGAWRNMQVKVNATDE